MKKLLEYLKKILEIRKLVSKMELLSYNTLTNIFRFARENENDLSSKPKEPTIPMNPKLYSDLDFKGYTNPAKTFNKNTLPKPKGVPSGSKI